MKFIFSAKKIMALALVTALGINSAHAQFKLNVGDPPAPVAADTAQKPARTNIKPYDKVVTKEFTTKKGLFTVHQNADKFLFEIPDELLFKEIMVINRLTKAPALHGMYAGEELDSKTIHFEKSPDSSIRIRYDLLINEAPADHAIYKSVEKASNNPIVANLPIIAYGNKSSVIDATRFLKEKNFVNSISPYAAITENVLAATMKDFYVESVKAFPINVEIKISKTMTSKAKILPEGTPASIETNTSFIALPDVPMQRRYFDPRVGYFADYFHVFNDNQQKAEVNKVIVRWRLEPKPEDMAKYKRGELVEPIKPIVIYIDPATPKQWRNYLILGINDWQKAFEQAGFKNAIVGKEWPENDTTMFLEDARHSMINYLPSNVSNAYGPNIHDPRSGEIIQTHIGWYHNIMELLNSWYMVQAAATDPMARNAKFDDKLMGELIRFVSSHEVGHTLGLRHNFGSSSRTPVDSLRSKTYLQKHGHTASIMDYARFNYVAQPEDKISQQELFPRIGEYDNWAIEWGYKFTGAASAEEDKKIVRKWIEDRTSKNPRLWFGDGETQKFDPQCQTEDLGDNAMKASTYGIKNLQRIYPNLPVYTAEEGGLNENLTKAAKAVHNQYLRYLLHVLKNISGTQHTIRADAETEPAYAVVPKDKKREALAFLNEQVLKTPNWLLDKNIINKIQSPGDPNFVEDVQVRVLNSLMDVGTIYKLLSDEKQFGKEAISSMEYINLIHNYIWADLTNGATINMDSYRRNLQKSYLGAVLDILLSKDANYNETDVATLAKVDIIKLQREINAAIPKAKDPLNLYHLKDIQDRIKTALNPKF